MIRSAKDVIAVAKSRGFSVKITPGPPVMPVLIVPGKADRSDATETLLNALRVWRLEIIEELSKATDN